MRTTSEQQITNFRKETERRREERKGKPKTKREET
jgi:hypothetical protein